MKNGIGAEIFDCGKHFGCSARSKNIGVILEHAGNNIFELINCFTGAIDNFGIADSEFAMGIDTGVP